jgi:hypothetical protein
MHSQQKIKHQQWFEVCVKLRVGGHNQ